MLGDDIMEQKEGFKSGFVTVIGQPNVGKSTLINKLIGEKISITSRKAQTTRNRIKCIFTNDEAQIVFVDTPGIHNPRDKMGEYLNKAAYNSLKGINLILFMVDINYPPNSEDKMAFGSISGVDIPKILVLNKIDQVNHQTIKKRISQYQQLADFDDFFAISARQEKNLTELVDKMIDLLPEGPMYYPEDMITDQIEQFVITEMIREKIIHFTHEEVPYSTAVEIVSFNQKDELIEISANIYVERASQKGILIGKNGQMIKRIGSAARKEIEKFLEEKIFLDLWVKVKEKWRKKEDSIKMLGYEV